MNVQRLLLALLFLAVTTMAQTPARRPLVVVSIDGLDYRYLRDCDKLGLRIPHLRRLMREGEMAEGVMGVFPTVTWPSHTTMITGVTPAEHGILGNRRPREEGGDYYWEASLLKARTLWHATRAAGLTSAAITWPVTVTDQIDFNLPEYFQGRNGGAMDLRSIESKATPGLVEKIQRVYPSFGQEWMDDRTRALATIYLLKYEKPALLLLHFVDLDAAAHHSGPFTREANSVLEYTDELLGTILAAVPREAVVALVSDHGFERADRVVDLAQALAKEGIRGRIEQRFGLATTDDPAVAQWLRASGAAGKYGIGREIPREERRRFAPQFADAAAAFEPAPHHLFGSAAANELYAKPAETGVHGLWPGRPDYRASFILWGRGIKPARRPAISMLEIAPRLAAILGVPWEKR